MSMLDILKKLNNIEGKKPINESVITECPPDMGPQQPSNVNISISGNSMADIMRALAGIEQSSAPRGDLLASPMDNPNIPGRDDVEGDDDVQDGVIGTAAGGALGALAAGPIGAGVGAVAGDALTGEEEVEEWDNEPDEDYRDHNFMTKDLSGGINRQKKMFAKAQDGDNAMAVESIKARLLKALDEAKKAKKDYDGDGKVEKPEEEWKGSRDKAIKKATGKTNEAKKAKPDYLDMDKDGNKKEPMKKAIADKKKKKVDENLNEGMRLVKKAENGNRSVKIYKDSEWDEFVLKHFENGEYLQDADYFDSDKQAVIDTAKHFLSGAQESIANEADRGGSHDKFLVYMQKGALNSQGDKKYYIIDYVVKPGFVHHPLALKKVFDEHPITQRLKGEGYVGPEMVSNIPDNIDAEIEKTKERIAQTEPHKDGFPVPYYDAVKRLKQLEKTKQLLNSVPLVKEADITELSRDTIGRYAAKAHNRGDMAARMSKRGDGKGYDKDMSHIANKRYQGVQTAINKLANRARVNPK